MNTKLDIEIILKENFIYDPLIKQYDQILGIKVNKVDDRFQVLNDTTSNVIFISKFGMKLLSSVNIPYGAIYNTSLVLPTPDIQNITLYYTFLSDMERKLYLKNLYNILIEWSNEWGGFSRDKPSHLTVYDNRWVIEHE